MTKRRDDLARYILRRTTAPGRQHDSRPLQGVGFTCDSSILYAQRETAPRGRATHCNSGASGYHTMASRAPARVEAAPGRQRDVHQLKVSTYTRRNSGHKPRRDSTNLIRLSANPPALHLRVSPVRASAHPRRSAQLGSPVIRSQHHTHSGTVDVHNSPFLRTLPRARDPAFGDEHCKVFPLRCSNINFRYGPRHIPSIAVHGCFTVSAF